MFWPFRRRNAAGHARRQGPPSARPRLEVLEDRLQPTCTPTGPVLEALQTCRNWITYAPPSPFNPGSVPVSTTQLRQTLQQLYNEGWRGLVTYSLDPEQGLDQAPRIAKEVGFTKVIAGLFWFNNAQLAREKQVAMAQVNYIDAFVVGSEGVAGNAGPVRYNLTQLQTEIAALRAATGRPVTTTEPEATYLNPNYSSLLTTVGDWVFPNVHPYNAGVRDVAAGVQYTRERYVNLQALAVGRSVILHESWWPTAGGPGASEANQREYCRRLAGSLDNTGCPVHFIWGEAYDQFWKTFQAHEPHWGFHSAAGVPKQIVGQLNYLYTSSYLERTPFTGDFNGDGRKDIAGFDLTGKWWVGLSNGTSQFVMSAMPWTQWADSPGWSKFLVGDFNGDNRDDVAGLYGDGTWWVGLSDGAGAFLTRPTPWTRWAAPHTWKNLFVGDFNADGRDDVAGFHNGGTWWVGLSDGSTAFLTRNTPWVRWPAAGWAKVFVGDFSGDGRDDVAGFYATGTWWVGVSNGSHAFLTRPTTWARWAAPATWRDLFVGDFNADGRDDVAGLHNTGTWWVGLSNGVTGFLTRNTSWARWPAAGWVKLVIGDFNGDSRDDVAGLYVDGTWRVGLSNGTHAFLTRPTPWVRWPVTWKQLVVGDIDGDGRDDVAGFYVDDTWWAGLSDGISSFRTRTTAWAQWHRCPG